MRASLLAALLVATFAAPATTHAAFDQFYTTPGSPVPLTPGVTTTINLFFDTNSIDLTGFSGGSGVFGWSTVLVGSGDLVLDNFVSGGDVDALSSCQGVNGTQQTCSALDAGAGALSGVAGIGVAMFSIDLLATTLGSELVATTLDFTEGNFTTTSVGPLLLARIIPEPGTALLLGAALAGLALLRRGSSRSRGA